MRRAKTRSQYRLGFFYEHGKGVEQDFEQAKRWYTEAANQGDSNAQYGLARLYREGKGVEADFEVGRDWYLKAAAAGLKGPLGAYYDPDPGTPVSKPMADLLEREAENGNIASTIRLAEIYRTGSGVAANKSRANIARPIESPRHKQVLPTCQQGEGTKPDTKAVFWYERAIEAEGRMALTNQLVVRRAALPRLCESTNPL